MVIEINLVDGATVQTVAFVLSAAASVVAAITGFTVMEVVNTIYGKGKDA